MQLTYRIDDHFLKPTILLLELDDAGVRLREFLPGQLRHSWTSQSDKKEGTVLTLCIFFCLSAINPAGGPHIDV